jgi:copper transport protein
LIKLGVIVPLLVLGAVNNRWTKPRIQRVAEEGNGLRAPVKTLRRLVLAEVALAGVVLAVTSVLVNLPPARLQAVTTGPFIADTRIGPYNLNVLVDPGEVGENIMHLTATTAAGTPARVLDMRVMLRMPSRDIGPIVAEGRKLAKGHFALQGRQLSVPGDWTLKVVARTHRFREERTTVEISVNS